MSLFLLNAQKLILELIKQAKGSSSHSITGVAFVLEKFAWQTANAAC